MSLWQVFVWTQRAQGTRRQVLFPSWFFVVSVTCIQVKVISKKQGMWPCFPAFFTGILFVHLLNSPCKAGSNNPDVGKSASECIPSSQFLFSVAHNLVMVMVAETINIGLIRYVHF
jgi:hypothetical protein